MSQPAPLGTSHLAPVACDLVAVGDSVDVTAGLVCTRGVIVGVGPNRLTISLAGAIETDVTTFSLTRTDHDGAAWSAECPGYVLVGARRLEITERVGWIAVDRRSARPGAPGAGGGARGRPPPRARPRRPPRRAGRVGGGPPEGPAPRPRRDGRLLVRLPAVRHRRAAAHGSEPPARHLGHDLRRAA